MYRVPVMRLRSLAFSAVSWKPIRWHRLYRYLPSTLSYLATCHPVGFTEPMFPRFSVGMVSIPTQA